MQLNRSMTQILAAVVLSLGFLVPVGAEELSLGGGGASIATVFAPVKAPFEKATGNTLYVLQSTPKNGLIDLVNGKLDGAVAAVPLESMVAGAARDGVTIDPATLQQTVVGKNRTTAFVNGSNPVTKLGKEQLKGIFTGRITNWKEVGGRDAEIIVVWGKNSPGQNGLFIKQVLDGEPVMKDILETTDYAGIKETVGFNSDAIGINPFSMADADFKAVQMPLEIESPIILVTRGKPSAKVQKLIDFIKGDGQKYVRQ